MRLTLKDLETKYAMLFLHCKDVKSAKAEVLALFSVDPDDEHEWSEQDIYEHIIKIIRKYE